MRNDFETGYLAHSAKGKTWQNHKYIAKHPLGNGLYKYFYTQAELDAFLKKKGGAQVVPSSQIGAKNYDKNAPKSVTSLKASSSNTAAVKQSLSSKNTTTNANKKTASEVTLSETKDKQEKGKNAAEKLLNKSSEKSSTNKSGGKKSSKGSSKSSSGGKTGKSSSSKKSGSGSSKEKTSKEKKSSGTKATKEKAESTKKSINKAEKETTPTVTIEQLNKAHGKEISSFNGSALEFKNNLISKYKEGSFGYLSAGNKVYKFQIKNGDVILKDYNTDKEVSFDKYLKAVRSFKEFKINK